MKKIFKIFLGLSAVFVLTGCTEKDKTESIT